MGARDYIGYLSTAYLELSAPVQEQVYSEISAVLPEKVELSADLTVHLAHRSDRR